MLSGKVIDPFSLFLLNQNLPDSRNPQEDCIAVSTLYTRADAGRSTVDR